MTTKETIEHLIQYKLEINRKLDIQGNFKNVGFTCVSGQRYEIYWIDKVNKNVLSLPYHIAANKSELLLAMQLLLKSINGVLTIGCHKIERSEINRFAALQGWGQIEETH